MAAPKNGPGVGMPAALKLEAFGHMLWQAFGHMPYHVGSSLESKVWRDVDVRVILPDEVYEAWGLGYPDHSHGNPRWRLLTAAFSALAREMTGLPVDFQIQQQTQANKIYQGPRSALCIFNEPKKPEPPHDR